MTNSYYLAPAGAGETWVLTHTEIEPLGPYSRADTFTDPRFAIHVLAGRVRKNWHRVVGKPGYPAVPPTNDFEAVAVYFRDPRGHLRGERFDLQRCKTNIASMPHVPGAAEYILVHPYQEWTCLCGNTAPESGFSPSDHRGVPTGDDGAWFGFHLCPDCGRVIHNETGQVIGRRAVEPTTQQPNPKQEVTVTQYPQRTAVRPAEYVDKVRMHVAAIAEHANRAARMQPVDGNYDVPFVTISGLDVATFADDEGRLNVDLDTQCLLPLADWPNLPEIRVEVDGQPVWSSEQPNDDEAWRVRALVETTLARTKGNAGDSVTFLDYLADLTQDLAMQMPAGDPLREAAEAERGNHAYTVTGMLDDSRNLTVTAVIAGPHMPVERREPGDYRFATVVYATSPAEAERLASEEAANSTDN